MVALAPSSNAANSVADARNIVADSNFATPSIGGTFVTVSPGSNIGPWTVGGTAAGSGVDINTAAQFALPAGDPSGAQSIDLSASNPGSITQTLATQAGQTYTGSFELAGNPVCLPNVKTGTLTVGSLSEPLSFDATNTTNTNMGWTEVDFSFVAAGASTPITLASTTSGGCGPVVTDVIVDPPLAPTITTNSNLTVYQTTAAGTPVSFAKPTATDPNGGTVSVACNPASGSVFPAGSTTVTCTATTSEGSTASSTFVVKVLPLKTSCEGLPYTDRGYLTAHPNYGANTPTSPCVASTYDLATTGPLTLVPAIPLLGIPATGVNVALLQGVTSITAAPGAVATASNSTIAAVSVSALGLTLSAHTIYSQATALLSGGLCNDEVTSGLSDIANLTINGKSIIVSTAPITIKLGLINVYVNQTVKVGNVVTQRALVVNIGGDPANDIVFGQAVAGVACS